MESESEAWAYSPIPSPNKNRNRNRDRDRMSRSGGLIISDGREPKPTLIASSRRRRRRRKRRRSPIIHPPLTITLTNPIKPPHLHLLPHPPQSPNPPSTPPTNRSPLQHHPHPRPRRRAHRRPTDQTGHASPMPPCPAVRHALFGPRDGDAAGPAEVLGVQGLEAGGAEG